jgi:hypothetical protein
LHFQKRNVPQGTGFLIQDEICVTASGSIPA